MKPVVITLSAAVLYAIFACASPDSKKLPATSFVSEVLIDQSEENLDYAHHDERCQGFLKHHFSYQELDAEAFFDTTGQQFLETTGLHWKPYRSNAPIIDFNLFFGKVQENKVVYFAEMVEAEKAETRILSVGSDDGFTLFVNGDSVYSRHLNRAIRRDEDLMRVHLKKGQNVLLYKIAQRTGDWGLCRRFIENGELHLLLDTKLFKDLPESCILPDTASFVTLKVQPTCRLDSIHTLQFAWQTIRTHPDNESHISRERLPAYRMPALLKLPSQFTGKAILDFQVSNLDGSLFYREEIPIFYASVADSMARDLVTKTVGATDRIVEVRRDAVKELFKLEADPERLYDYSTRMRAHALIDLYRTTQFDKSTDAQFGGSRIWAYRSRFDQSAQVFNVFAPHIQTSPAKLPLIISISPSMKDDKNNIYWRNRWQAGSHAVMTNRISYTASYPSIIVTPHGRGQQMFWGEAIEEIPLVIDELVKYWPVDTSNISIFTFCEQAPRSLELMNLHKLPIKEIGILSPDLPSPFEEKPRVAFTRLLKKTLQNFPDLKWSIWHGALDDRIDIRTTRKWIGIMKELGCDVDFFDMPYSTHVYFYPYNPEERFVQKMNPN